ncbi:GerAB/ArcD/ProY family transporter [Paenibacillus sp. HB172176]|uniref:GerAB/ArcD/ProY family transporter n=1 Tax=Paenibacillus sp. HB172176 TaxID=2493690 RepID=UPI00143AF222|nr:GerAB/ArcD/ProY family transporter [Paenibacillus sp. HB172176]
MDKTWQVASMYFMTHLGLIFFIYPGAIIASTTQGHWIPIVMGFIVHMAAISFYMKGLKDAGNMDIISLNLKFGKGMPILILLPLTLYLLMSCIVTVRSLAEMMTIVFLSNTPLWAIMILFLLISTYMAFKGISSILRTGVLIGLLNVPIMLFFSLFSFQNVDWHYVFPLLGGFSFLTNPYYLQSLFVFTGGFLFLGFIPSSVAYRKRSVWFAAMALLPFFLFSVYIPLLTFGEATASTFIFPFIVSLDTIAITWSMFDRITIFLFLSLVSFIMLFLSITLWSMMRVVSTCFTVAKSSYWLIFISVLVFLACMAIPNWKDVEAVVNWDTSLRIYILIAVPLSTYFIGRHLKGRVSYDATD